MAEEIKEIQAPNDPVIGRMFEAGVHFGYSRSRRHPSMEPFIFGVKNRVEIFDLEKTKKALDDAKAFLSGVAALGKNILIVGGKDEAMEAVKSGAMSCGLPYVAGRWIGGTLTNFTAIKSRVAKLVDLTDKREKGELAKYTKKERLLIDREIKRLEEMFFGILPMKDMPAAIFIIDPKKEKTAVAEARGIGLPVVALLNSDCDLKDADYPIPGNDAARSSIKFFVEEIISAIREGKEKKAVQPVAPAQSV